VSGDPLPADAMVLMVDGADSAVSEVKIKKEDHLAESDVDVRKLAAKNMMGIEGDVT
jgi:hypothetical protein